MNNNSIRPTIRLTSKQKAIVMTDDICVTTTHQQIIGGATANISRWYVSAYKQGYRQLNVVVKSSKPSILEAYKKAANDLNLIIKDGKIFII